MRVRAVCNPCAILRCAQPLSSILTQQTIPLLLICLEALLEGCKKLGQWWRALVWYALLQACIQILSSKSNAALATNKYVSTRQCFSVRKGVQFCL